MSKRAKKPNFRSDSRVFLSVTLDCGNRERIAVEISLLLNLLFYIYSRLQATIFDLSINPTSDSILTIVLSMLPAPWKRGWSRWKFVAGKYTNWDKVEIQVFPGSHPLILIYGYKLNFAHRNVATKICDFGVSLKQKKQKQQSSHLRLWFNG